MKSSNSSPVACEHLIASNQMTGPLFRELLDTLCDDGLNVTLIAGWVDARADYQPKYRMRRCFAVNKRTRLKRLLTWGLFTIQAMLAIIRRRRGSFALLVTNPPFVPWLGPLLKRCFGVRYGLLIYDVYPDVLVEANMIRDDGILHRWLKRRSAKSLEHAEFVITLGPMMKKSLEAHLPRKHAVEIDVVSVWANTEEIHPMPRDENFFVRDHGLRDKFVVMYSGAFSEGHDLHSVVGAAELLAETEDVRFVLIGEGVQRRTIEQAIADKHLANCLLLPFQPLDSLCYSLSAADCQIVSMAAGQTGTIVPSKTYSNMAAGCAILAVAPRDSEVAQLTRDNECGICIEPHDPQALAAAVRTLLNDRTLLTRMKANARELAESRYNREACTRRYQEILYRHVKPQQQA
jgi:glycosyltransferase involved in cell wall biosynthesis